MADLRARGIIKDRTPEEQEAHIRRQADMADDGPPWALIIGGVAGVLLLMIAMGAGITYLIIKYADVSRVSTRFDLG